MGTIGVQVGSSYPMLPPNSSHQVFVENHTDCQNPPPGEPTSYGVQFARHAYTTGSASFLNKLFWASSARLEVVPREAVECPLAARLRSPATL
jgi:hypothetical protein